MAWHAKVVAGLECDRTNAALQLLALAAALHAYAAGSGSSVAAAASCGPGPAEASPLADTTPRAAAAGGLSRNPLSREGDQRVHDQRIGTAAGGLSRSPPPRLESPPRSLLARAGRGAVAGTGASAMGGLSRGKAPQGDESAATAVGPLADAAKSAAAAAVARRERDALEFVVAAEAARRAEAAEASRRAGEAAAARRASRWAQGGGHGCIANGCVIKGSIEPCRGGRKGGGVGGTALRQGVVVCGERGFTS